MNGIHQRTSRNVGSRIRLTGNIVLHNWQPEGELTESNLLGKLVHSAEVIGDEPVVSFDATRSKHFLGKDGP